MSSVSKNIKKLRLQRKFTQEDMANKLFVTRQTVSNWENGKSQPDIDTLIRVAETLDTDITTLIYGLNDSVNQKKEIKRLIVAGSILLILSFPLHFLNKTAHNMMFDYFNSAPMYLLRLLYLPIFWLVLGWTLMQGLGVLKIIKPTKSKYNKALHIAVLVIVLLYCILMLPYFIESIKCTVLSYQYNQNPSLYPNGFSYVYNVPSMLINIEKFLIDVLYKQPIIFIIPAIFFWFSRPINKD